MSEITMSDAVQFELGQKVYLRCHQENEFGYVTGITFRPYGHTFCVTWSDRIETSHFGLELSADSLWEIKE